MKKEVAIFGAGPAGLFCAYQLLKYDFKVDLYDRMSGVGKKFLVAGIGGLNLTHSGPLDNFCEKYGENTNLFSELIKNFTPNDLRTWCTELGVETFVGSSGRVFPVKMNAAEMIIKWTEFLKSFESFNLYLNHELVDIDKDKNLSISKKDEIEVFEKKYDKVILSMGGANWSKTGSNGKWKSFLEKVGIEIEDFRPANSGFERGWSEHLISKIDGRALKNIEISIGEYTARGEAMLCSYGIEGGAIYALSRYIRDEIYKNKTASISIDLCPDLSFDEVSEKLKNKKAKETFANHLRKKLHLNKEKYILLREFIDSTKIDDIDYLATSIKGLSISLNGVRPIDEAISTAGGVKFSNLNTDFEIKIIPGLYIAGEMLDFEAPTGGYLLQGCFSTAWAVVEGIRKSYE